MPDHIGTEKLSVTILDQPLVAAIAYGRDAAREMRFAGRLSAPALDLGRITGSLLKLEPGMSVTGRVAVEAHASGPPARPAVMDVGALVTAEKVEVRHPFLKTFTAGVSNLKLQVSPDDVTILDCQRSAVFFGVRSFPPPLCGSLKQMVGVENLFTADPTIVGPRIMDRIGGTKKLLSLMGEDQILRIAGDQLYKVKVGILVKDRPDPFVFQTAMTPEETKGYREDWRRIVDKYTRVAKQQLASDMGFRMSVYGNENYKMLRITRVKLIVLDKAFNMVYPSEIPFWRLTVTPWEW
ncbi:MAG: hypothetical protein HY815_05530 [Candidatus Riflebacteria bacterium]|nr:hypothetical protein [Candidatus Riflebacteria bacterium]